MGASTLFIGGLGPTEIIIILVVVLVVFGGRKIPGLAKDLGSGIREFRKSLSGASTEISDGMEDETVETQTQRKASKKKRS